MMRLRKGLRGAAGAAFCAAAALLAGCEEESQAPVADVGVQEMMADQVTYGLEQYLTTDGVRTGVVISDSSYIYDDSASVRLFGVDMILYEEAATGKEKARVTALHGKLNQRTEAMTAWGDAVLEVRDQGLRVESSELHYDPGQNQIRSDSATTMTVNGAVSRGSCFRSDLEFSNFSVCDPVGAIPNELPGGGRRPGGGGGGGGR